MPVAIVAALASNWLAILKVILLIGTGVAVGYTVYKYITALEQPAVTQTFQAVAQLVPMMVTLMTFQTMVMIMSTMREMMHGLAATVAEKAK